MKKLLAIFLVLAALFAVCPALEITLEVDPSRTSAAEAVAGVVYNPTVAAAAAPGTADNPVISLSYLKGTITPQLYSQINAYTKSSFALLYADFFYEASQAVAARNLRRQMADDSGRLTEGSIRLKKGDAVILAAGSSFFVEAGTGFAKGSLSNVTGGTTVGDGDWLPTAATCMSSGSNCGFTVESDTMQVVMTGLYALDASDSTDYNSTADALKSLGLFRGDSTGYALERSATRIEALVMFIRLLGEEDEAMASTATHPFTDVDSWAQKYVAYAYSKGYTKGVSDTSFGSASPVAAKDYMTFLLRALGYAEGTDFSWNTAVENARTLNILNYTEAELVADSFLRAQVAYVSYYALFAKVESTGLTLLQTLQNSGSVSNVARSAAMVVGARMGA